MIIDQKVQDLVVVGEDTSKKAKISQDKLAKLQYLLTKGLYKDPITAVIAEWTNNGIDSVVQAGKDPTENPVIVSIAKNTKGQYVFRVEDKGTGLDNRDFEDICMNYLESTKEKDNDTIGHFGIGMKSFLSLERPATFTCIKNGIKRKYLVYEGSEFVNYDLIIEEDTEEENGVTAELMISDWSERSQFVTKAKTKLAYYDTVALLIDGQIVENDIYRNELFQWSTQNINHYMHLCLKDVYYTIDWDALGINMIPLPVALRMNLSDGIKPTPSRESYITNEETKKIILDRIREIGNWFVDQYNLTVRNFKTFIEAYPYLEQSPYIRVKDKDFYIDAILHMANKKLASPKIDGISLIDPLEYKRRRGDMFVDYTPLFYCNNSGVMKSKFHQDNTNHILNGNTTVLIEGNFRGNAKLFLKEKYGRNVMFLKKNSYVRKLGLKMAKNSNGHLVNDPNSYYHILNLRTVPRDKWRDHIKEWNFVISTIVSTFKDERKVTESQEFLDWLEKRREQARLRKGTRGSLYQGLSKQSGDVTLAYTYERYSRAYYGKKAFPIDSLKDNKFLTVLVTDQDNVNLAKNIWMCMKKKDRIRFAYVGKKEIKKVPKHFQFINFQSFMSRDCKPFMRLASAIKFEELLKHYDDVDNFKEPAFKNVLKGIEADATKLKNYVKQNSLISGYPGLQDEVKTAIINIADQNDLYDKILWSEYLRVKDLIHRYDFISFIKTPYYINGDLNKRYETLINQILLFRKKYYDDLPEGAKIVFDNKTNQI